MNWTRGISASYYLATINPETWFDEESIKITGGSIKKTVSGLRESATVHTVGKWPYSGEKWIRLYMIARQGAGSERVPLFTGLAISSSSQKGNLVNTTIECYSVLSVIDDVLLPRGWYAPVGTNAVMLVRDLLSETTKAPVEIETVEEYPRIENEAIVADGGETYLSMIEKILAAIEWRIKIGGDGKIYILQMAKSESLTFDSLVNSVIDTNNEISIECDWKSCPNVFRAVLNDGYAIARDESDDSPFSIQNRGREIWAEEQNVALSDTETLSDYAIRRLNELQQISVSTSYERRFVPDIYPSDIIRLNYPAQGLSGNYLIASQDIELNYGASVTEEVIKL